MTPTRCSATRRGRGRTGLGLLLAGTLAAGAGASLGTPARAASGDARSVPTQTPIKHVIVVIGENRTYDNVFATWTPPAGQHARTLLSQGIVTAGGDCGPAAERSMQRQASDVDVYRLTPPRTVPYPALPRPDTTTARGLPPNVPDTRFPATLPNCPYRITRYVPYAAYTGDPIHRFYQMWQQVDGGRNDLWVWTANTAGFDNGAVPPQPIHQGALQMGYYSMGNGDAPVLRFLADHYASSDNYHQAVMGGTGANHIILGTADAAFHQDAAGHPTNPPQNQIENPNPKPGTNNNFTQDGYRGGATRTAPTAPSPGSGRSAPSSTSITPSAAVTAPTAPTTCSTTTTPATSPTAPRRRWVLTTSPSRRSGSAPSATRWRPEASPGATTGWAGTGASRPPSTAASATRCSTPPRS